MGNPVLSDALKRAGEEFRERLKLLGLDPEGLLWAHDAHDEAFHLWLIWSGVDHVGPYQVAKLLFRAYNLSALPKEIDPFVVQILSPRHSMTSNLRRLVHEKRKNNIPVAMKTEQPRGVEQTRFSQAWIYKFDDADAPLSRTLADWNTFSFNVDALAA